MTYLAVFGDGFTCSEGVWSTVRLVGQCHLNKYRVYYMYIHGKQQLASLTSVIQAQSMRHKSVDAINRLHSPLIDPTTKNGRCSAHAVYRAESKQDTYE